jgi:phosphate starvation-inducible PhoH-like protein
LTDTPSTPASVAEISVQTLELQPENASRLANLSGNLDSHIHQIADHYQLVIYNRGGQFRLEGDREAGARAARLIDRLYSETANGTPITPDLIHLLLSEDKINQQDESDSSEQQPQPDPQHGSLIIKTPQAHVKVRGKHQREYIDQIRRYDISFGIGPAGTGKTFLAVAAAVEALLKDDVRRILLVRPAVEAGEKLGFLPGDLAQKIDPYLRPLYDALYEMLGFEYVGKLMERNVIEVAPLAYMRGRTLSHSFVILDESQNTTKEQMKMFLTRIGFNSKAVITGDITQVDLPSGKKSGLIEAKSILQNIDGIRFVYFSKKDVVRHKLVMKIISAYEKNHKNNQNVKNR